MPPACRPCEVVWKQRGAVSAAASGRRHRGRRELVVGRPGGPVAFGGLVGVPGCQQGLGAGVSAAAACHGSRRPVNTSTRGGPTGIGLPLARGSRRALRGPVRPSPTRPRQSCQRRRISRTDRGGRPTSPGSSWWRARAPARPEQPARSEPAARRWPKSSAVRNGSTASLSRPRSRPGHRQPAQVQGGVVPVAGRLVGGGGSGPGLFGPFPVAAEGRSAIRRATASPGRASAASRAAEARPRARGQRELIDDGIVRVAERGELRLSEAAPAPRPGILPGRTGRRCDQRRLVHRDPAQIGIGQLVGGGPDRLPDGATPRQAGRG